MQFVIFHGSFGMNSINWFPYLRKRLQGDGHDVLAPNMPQESWERMTKLGLKAKNGCYFCLPHSKVAFSFR